MITLKKLDKVLKESYQMVVGDITIREIKKKLVKIPKIKVKGRSLITGRKKSVNIGISDFLR
jgi:actin-like ATPase involved in cell morphogenesis